MGSTIEICFVDDADEDHPHVCGKYVYVCCVSCIELGSPPRVWEVLTSENNLDV